MPHVTITRRLTFNAAHRVFIPALSDDENLKIFGKCSNPNWHGHNYVLEVSVTGPVDDATGYVLDLAALRDIVRAEIIEKVDHKNLNLDVDFMRGVIPTAENLAIACWRILSSRVAPARLRRIRLKESENNWVEYDGDGA